MERQHYLGDGLYVKYDGMHYVLLCERDNGINWVALEDGEVLPNFFKFIERTAGVRIRVERVKPGPAGAADPEF